MSFKTMFSIGSPLGGRPVKLHSVYQPGSSRECSPTGVLPDPALPSRRADGADIINTFNEKPATLSLGTGELAPAVEARLIGLPEGHPHHVRSSLRAKRSVTVTRKCCSALKRGLLDELGDPDATYHVGDVVQFPTPDAKARTRAWCARWPMKRWSSTSTIAGGPARGLRSSFDRGAVMSGPLDEVVLAAPRGFARASTAPSRSWNARSASSARDLLRHEIVPQHLCGERPEEQGRDLHRRPRRSAAGATLVSAPTACRRRCGRSGGARFQRFDATCPLVTKVHVEVAKLHKEGYDFVMIGHKGHPEVEGTMGQLTEGIYLVEDVADVERLEVAQSDKLAV